MQNEITKPGHVFLFFVSEKEPMIFECVPAKVGDTIETIRSEAEMSLVTLFSEIAKKQGIHPDASGANEVWFPPGDH